MKHKQYTWGPEPRHFRLLRSALNLIARNKVLYLMIAMRRAPQEESDGD